MADVTISMQNSTLQNVTEAVVNDAPDNIIIFVAILSGVLVILIVALTILFLIRGVAVKRSFDRRHTGVHETDTSQVEVVRRVRTRRAGGKMNGEMSESSQRMLDDGTFRLADSDEEGDEFV